MHCGIFLLGYWSGHELVLVDEILRRVAPQDDDGASLTQGDDGASLAQDEYFKLGLGTGTFLVNLAWCWARSRVPCDLF